MSHNSLIPLYGFILSRCYSSRLRLIATNICLWSSLLSIMMNKGITTTDDIQHNWGYTEYQKFEGQMFVFLMVRTERLELSHLAALEPKSSVSTNSTTSA